MLKHFDVVEDDSTISIMIDILVPLSKVDNKAENARHFLYKRFHEKLELSIFLATKFPSVSQYETEKKRCEMFVVSNQKYLRSSS